MAVDFIDYNQIRQPKVKKFIITHGLTSTQGFKQLVPVRYVENEEATYCTHHQQYLVKKDLDTVWNAYVSIHPRDAWHGSMVSFGLQYDRHSETINYLNDPYSGLQAGQVLILNLRMLGGLLNLAVAHEVEEVCSKQHLIKLSYMQGGASEGSQWIRLEATPDGFTRISHLTRYKSKSPFRDKALYPPLHTKAIGEFHASVRKKLGLR